MKTFLRLENLILPTAQIKSIATPTVNGESIMEVAIFALTELLLDRLDLLVERPDFAVALAFDGL